MDTPKQLAELRKHIDGLDDALTALFERRMEAARKVADLKGMGNLAITDEARETQIISRTREAVKAPDLKGDVAFLMRCLITVSKERQRRALLPDAAPLLPPPAARKAENVVCAFQGTPGAWSEQALTRLFPNATARQTETFEDLFVAVRDRVVDYGVAPIENSKTGAIGEIYDLLRKYGCYVVGRTWVDIRHCLIAPKGTRIEDVREVLSHPEGFRQCAAFLRGRAWDLTACRNTAVAAETAAASRDGRTAAVGSRRAAQLNGLDVLAPDIMDSESNRTSFVAIAAAPQYDARDDLISLTFSAPHRSGALCEILMPFMAGGLNLTRIESRPSGEDRYRFFLEVRGNILDPNTAEALRYAAACSEYLEVIGCYSDI